jgi:hypothetical protein
MSLVTTVKFGYTSKTKVVMCSKGKYRLEVKLKLAGIELDYTDAYLYLGVLFHYTGSVKYAKKKLVEDDSGHNRVSSVYKIRNIFI